MNKQEIIQSLTKKHNDFISLIEKLDDKQFMFAPTSKWTAGQQLDHIYRSVSPVLIAFRLPAFVPSLLFGKANRPSRGYDELIQKYHSKLAGGGAASGRFVPKAVQLHQKKRLNSDLLKTIHALGKQVERCSEEKLDKYILPHPLLGKLTFREMLYFTLYHVEHHHKLVIKNLEGSN
ncbi:MAG: DinB family protein [Bacteroidia bacterium]